MHPQLHNHLKVCFTFPGLENLDEEDAELFKLTNPKDVKVPNNYKGPQLKFPLSMNQVESLIDAFKRKQVNVILYIFNPKAVLVCQAGGVSRFWHSHEHHWELKAGAVLASV